MKTNKKIKVESVARDNYASDLDEIYPARSETNPPYFVFPYHSAKTKLQCATIVWNIPSGVTSWVIDVPIDEEGYSDCVKIRYEWPEALYTPEKLYAKKIAQKEMTEDSPKITAISEKVKQSFASDLDDRPTSEITVYIDDMHIKNRFTSDLETDDKKLPNGRVITTFVLLIEVEEVDTKYTATKKVMSLADYL